ncbi:MAG: ABC transporter ATP-binding protein, partial [Proteobacteria bacterium]|nr:ABC transporter ATP-binding protein [Pseudomonadota bacterium]
MARVEFRNIEKRFGDVTALLDINLTIEDGEFVALLGPSGCGKSTSLFLLAGIYMPTDGEILFGGHVVNEVESRDRNVGIVFQSYALYPHMTVRNNIKFPLRFQKSAAGDLDQRAEEAAKLVHVGELLDRRPSQLSGGQQQRVALARALVKRPQLLLLDEPLSNLDASLRLTMRTEIKELQKQLGVTTILVTHDQMEATTMADRIICMRDGQIEQIGKPDDLYLRPSSLFIAEFIGSPPINLLEGHAADGVLQINGVAFDCTAQAAGPVSVGLRPEHIAFADHGLSATVAHVEPMGREVLYVLDSAVGTLRVLQSGSSILHQRGETVSVGFNEENTLLFDRGTGQRFAPAIPGLPDAAPTVLRSAGRTVRLKWRKLNRHPDDPPFARRNLR